MEETRIERINPCLNVKDITASVKYYVNNLGFDVYVELLDFAIVERDGHQIHLTKSNQDITPSQVWIGVDTLQLLFEQAQRNGVRNIQQPTNFSWAYQMVVEDLDGNQLIIGAEPKDDQPYSDDSP